MRQLTVAVLFAFALAAFAQEGEQVRPRIDVPGEKSVEKQLSVTKMQMDEWELTEDDQAALKEKLTKLNTARAELLGALAQLEQQEAELFAFVKPMLPEEKKTDFDLRVKLQPLINWLKLSPDKAAELVAARKELLEAYGGKGATPAAKIAALTGGEVTKENRAKYIELVRNYRKFQKEWITKVENLLDESQKRLWNQRYLRTAYNIKEGL